MKTIQIKNLRGLTDTGEVPLNQISVLVGANSSGKSTFLRLLPLLKQGFGARKSGPILWYGEEVDFGSFKTSVRSGQESIGLSFGIDVNTMNFGRPYYRYNRVNLASKLAVKVSINIIKEYISELEIFVEDQQIKLTVDCDTNAISSCIINNQDYTDKMDGVVALILSNSILPTVFCRNQTKSERIYFERSWDEKQRYFVGEIRDLIDKRAALGTIDGIVNDICINSKGKILEKAKASKFLRSWQRKMMSVDKNSPLFTHLNDYIILYFFADILDSIDSALCQIIKNSHYMGPVRASAQRYYRVQNLSVSSIDSMGQSLPMFLANMSDAYRKRFHDWMSSHFGFYPEVKNRAGHISMYLVDGNKGKYNMADRGFGYSQILPIITQLWALTIDYGKRTETSIRVKRSNVIIYAIEQPELHLHPFLQKIVAKAFVAATEEAKRNNIDLKIVIETHSSTIIETLGELVEQKEISQNDITIALFDEVSQKSACNVRLANYEENGFLENWPIGFFD